MLDSSSRSDPHATSDELSKATIRKTTKRSEKRPMTGTTPQATPPELTLKLANARLRWLENGLPYSLDFEDTYHSSDGAQAESRHVFIAGSALPARGRTHARGPASTCCIGELGFGCGLNFLETLRAWRSASDRPARLNYVAFEKHPLRREDLERALSAWPDLAEDAQQLLRRYPDHSLGCHRLQLEDVTLDLYYGEALSQLNSLDPRSLAVDAWYLDGFSPALNPSLWDEAIAHRIAELSAGGASVASYSVAGGVRRALAGAGFAIEKRTGFGRKRHCLAGRLGKETALPARRPAQNEAPTAVNALVIGAGLAGIFTARALRRRGARVTLVDAAPSPLSGASGIAQLALRPRLFAAASADAQFFLKAFIYSQREYAAHGALWGWQGCGVLQLEGALNRKRALTPSTLTSLYDERVVTPVDSQRASALAGISLGAQGLFFPSGGWIDSGRLWDSLATEADEFASRTMGEPMCIRQQTRIVSLGREVEETGSEHWVATDSRGERFTASHVIVCNAGALDELMPDSGLRLQSARGQVSRILPTATSAALGCVVSAERSLFPLDQGGQLIAASYRRDLRSLETSQEDDRANLEGLRDLLPETLVEASHEDGSRPRVAIRSAGEDFLPVIGPAPDPGQIAQQFAALRRNAQAALNASPALRRGLYLNVGHGSNGTASCPLAGEYLASLIYGEPLPLNAAEASLVAPWRFQLRELKRQRG